MCSLPFSFQEFQSPKVSLLAWWSARCKCARESSVFRFITPDPNYGTLPWEPDPRTRRCHRGVSWGGGGRGYQGGVPGGVPGGTRGGRHVYWPPGDCCLPADAPLPCSPTSKLVTLYIFLLRVSVYLRLPRRSPDSHESHFSLWRKSVSLRSKSDFSAPLPEQNDAVCDYFYRRRGVIQYLYWSIMIYITLYGQTRFSKKGTLTCTIDTTYGLQTLNFRSHTFVSLVQCLHISSLARHSVLSTFLFGHNISSPAFPT